MTSYSDLGRSSLYAIYIPMYMNFLGGYYNSGGTKIREIRYSQCQYGVLGNYYPAVYCYSTETMKNTFVSFCRVTTFQYLGKEKAKIQKMTLQVKKDSPKKREREDDNDDTSREIGRAHV